VQFGDIDEFLHKKDNTTCTKLLDVLCTFEKKAKLQIELAVVIDRGYPFVKATYNLEGDGPLAVECFDIIETVKAAILAFRTPNLQAVFKKISESSDNLLLWNVFQCTQRPQATIGNDRLQQGMLQYAKACSSEVSRTGIITLTIHQELCHDFQPLTKACRKK